MPVSRRPVSHLTWTLAHHRSSCRWASSLSFTSSSSPSSSVHPLQDLYPSSQPKRSPKPWASPRPDRAILLSKALPSPEAHETIDRATRLHKVSTANGRLAALKRKHALLFEACEELRLTSKVHYDLATQAPPGTLALDVPVLQAKGKFEGLFPREMRLPTETPGNKGWDYDWKFVPEKKAKEEIDFYS